MGWLHIGSYVALNPAYVPPSLEDFIESQSKQSFCLSPNLYKMEQPESNIPVPYYTFKDKDEDPEVDYTLLKIRVDSDEGRVYTTLSTDAERLEYMRNHAHDRVGHVTPQWSFYEDPT
jgi:hypothetical protein